MEKEKQRNKSKIGNSTSEATQATDLGNSYSDAPISRPSSNEVMEVNPKAPGHSRKAGSGPKGTLNQPRNG